MVHKAGPSRRMQKQGPPPALDERLTSKKRKLAAPTNGAIKKQRRQDVAARPKPAGSGGARVVANSAGRKDREATPKKCRSGHCPN